MFTQNASFTRGLQVSTLDTKGDRALCAFAPLRYCRCIRGFRAHDIAGYTYLQCHGTCLGGIWSSETVKQRGVDEQAATLSLWHANGDRQVLQQKAR